MHHERPWRAGALLFLVLTVTLAPAPAAADFDAQASASQQITTAKLQPPTQLTTAITCVNGRPVVQLRWTPTASVAARGYEIYRADDGYDISFFSSPPGQMQSLATVQGRATASYTDETVNRLSKYRYAVRSTRASWTSAFTPEVAARTPLFC